MLIETAGLEDAASILELQKLCYLSEAALWNDYSIPPLVQTLESMNKDVEVQVVLKATISGRIIGSVRAHESEGTCKIGRLIVHPDHQNKGIGRQLMAAIESMFPNSDRFELFTGEISTKNLAFYGKLGYKKYRKEHLTRIVTIAYLEKPNTPKTQLPSSAL